MPRVFVAVIIEQPKIDMIMDRHTIIKIIIIIHVLRKNFILKRTWFPFKSSIK